jgi:hypothetical protein
MEKKLNREGAKTQRLELCLGVIISDALDALFDQRCVEINE